MTIEAGKRTSVVTLLVLLYCGNTAQLLGADDTPSPKPTAYVAFKVVTNPIAPGTLVSCRSIAGTQVYAGLPGTEPKLLNGIVFSDPRAFFGTSDGKLTGYLISDSPLGWASSALDTEILYLAKNPEMPMLLLNGLPIKEAWLRTRFIKRIVVRSSDLDFETEANRYTVARSVGIVGHHGPGPGHGPLLLRVTGGGEQVTDLPPQPAGPSVARMARYLDGTYLDLLANNALGPCILEKR